MNVLITTGPSWEPLDGMRRFTNASTGRLGTILADAFAGAGWEVELYRGEASNHGLLPREARVETFSTNDDLAARLAHRSEGPRPDAVLHAAALCDYRTVRILDACGRMVRDAKASTRDGRITVEMEPATKILPRLREWFPGARILGWKYELDGDRIRALARARRQIWAAGSDGCILNGAAYGNGFGLCVGEADPVEAPDAESLGRLLVGWLAELTTACGARSSASATAVPVEGGAR
jgi:phosphopantothenoylcysteine decarboxylase/phosphopantothenate--cysteine ligase